MSIFVNALGILFIAFIVWWFWVYKGKSEASVEGDKIDIVVDGGVYEPSLIHAPLGMPITLRFIRKDSNPCAEKVVFDGLPLSADLELEKPYEMSFTPDKKGEFEFTCQMAMYRGKLVVE